MNLSTLDKHSDLDSPVHRQNALVKLLSFVAFVVVVVLLPSGAVFPLLAAAATLLCVALVSRVPLAFLLRRTLVVVPFVLLIGGVNLLGRGLDFMPAWASWGVGHTWMDGSSAVREGSDAALASFGVMAMKSFISVFSLGLLLSTTGSARLLAAARRAGMPAILTVATGFMLRYLFVLVDELSRLRRSWEARRVGRLHWLTEFRYLGSLIGVLLVKSYERAERVYLAMCARGFDGFEPIGTLPGGNSVRAGGAVSGVGSVSGMDSVSGGGAVPVGTVRRLAGEAGVGPTSWTGGVSAVSPAFRRCPAPVANVAFPLLLLGPVLATVLLRL